MSGLKARGGFEVAMAWKDGRLTQATVTSTLGGNLRIRSAVPLKGLKVAKGTNKNPFYDIPSDVKQRVNYPERIQPLPALQTTYLYDIPTKKGQTIVLTAK